MSTYSFEDDESDEILGSPTNKRQVAVILAVTVGSYVRSTADREWWGSGQVPTPVTMNLLEKRIT